MSAELIDIRTRTAAPPPDASSIIQNLSEGADVLCAAFASWPHRFLREDMIVGAERNLVEIQRLLVELRTFIPLQAREKS